MQRKATQTSNVSKRRIVVKGNNNTIKNSQNRIIKLGSGKPIITLVKKRG